MKTTYTPQEENSKPNKVILGYLGRVNKSNAQKTLDQMQLEQDNLVGKNDYGYSPE